MSITVCSDSINLMSEMWESKGDALEMKDLIDLRVKAQIRRDGNTDRDATQFCEWVGLHISDVVWAVGGKMQSPNEISKKRVFSLIEDNFDPSTEKQFEYTIPGFVNPMDIATVGGMCFQAFEKQQLSAKGSVDLPENSPLPESTTGLESTHAPANTAAPESPAPSGSSGKMQITLAMIALTSIMMFYINYE